MSDNIDIKLWDAARDGDEALVSQLIEQGASVDWSEGGLIDQLTALHGAAYRGHTPVVTLLLDAGWSLEAETGGGDTPLAWVALRGHLEMAKCLLDRGANINTQTSTKWTPLHRASYGGFTDLARLLLQRGANQEIRNKDGKTASEYAKNDETRAVFSEFNHKRFKTKEDRALEEKKGDNISVSKKDVKRTKSAKKEADCELLEKGTPPESE